jgi:hypothetical protein
VTCREAGTVEKVEDPVVTDAGVGVLAVLDHSVGALRAGRQDLHDKLDVTGSQ